MMQHHARIVVLDQLAGIGVLGVYQRGHGFHVVVRHGDAGIGGEGAGLGVVGSGGGDPAVAPVGG